MQKQNRIVTEFKSPFPIFFAGIAFALLVPLITLLFLHPFDGLYGQDPYAYYEYATGPLRESLLNFQPLPAFFWPPGYPLLVAIATFFVGIRPVAGQIVSLIGGALVPVFTVLLAKEIFEEEKNWLVPAFAGVLVALTPQLWQSSVVVMSDTTGLAAATLGVWALVLYGKNPLGNFKWLGLATIGMSYAVLTRWAYALTAFLCGVYVVWTLRRTPRGVVLLHLIGATALAGGILSPVILPALSVIFSPEPQTSAFAGDLVVHKWNPLNAVRREFVTEYGNLQYSLPNGLYYAAAPAHRYFFTPMLAWLLLPGMWTFTRNRDTSRWLILGWAGMVYGFHAGAHLQNFRFTLAYLPPMAIIAAFGLEYILAQVPEKFHWGVGAVIGLGLGWMVFGGWTLTESFISRKDAELETVSRVEQQLPDGARLLTFGLTLTFQHYSSLETYEIFSLETDDLANLIAEGKPTYLFLELDVIESQWLNRPPSENYHWLLDGPGLVEISEIEIRGLPEREAHVFTLLEVQQP